MQPNKMPTDKPGDTANPTDPFDLSRLRLPQDFGAEVGAKKALLTVPVRKPDRQAFFRVHADPAYRLETAVLEVKEDRETYLVEPELWPDLAGEVAPKVLLTGITKQGIVFLWPIRLPGLDGRHDAWNRSALEAAELATHKWIRLAANMGLGAYDVFEATGNIPAPEWPSVPFQTLVRTAFKDRFVDSPDHPAVRRLRGEI